ncbi:hypothetical protein ACFONG_19355 [Uliginosibacterium paludis]|uniref:Secreted protein n=1 Tax=Uliginosibacterium paludis TaxID=1615952 RepID=A0ABV2CUA5_9RHOO
MHALISRIALLLLTLVAAFSINAQDVGVLHLTPLHLQLPPTWQFDGSKNPIEGKGANGEKMLISKVRRSKPEAPPATIYAEKMAETHMAAYASNKGKAVIRPVSETPSLPGKKLFSAASEKTALFGGKSYFIQYILANNDYSIYITIEGNGGVSEVIDGFDSIIKTQTWDE